MASRTRAPKGAITFAEDLESDIASALMNDVSGRPKDNTVEDGLPPDQPPSSFPGVSLMQQRGSRPSHFTGSAKDEVHDFLVGSTNGGAKEEPDLATSVRLMASSPLGGRFQMLRDGSRFSIDGDESFPADYFQAMRPSPAPTGGEDWITKFLALLWPKASEAVMKICRDQVIPILQKSLEKYMMSEVSFTKMSLGDKPPQISSIECYKKDKQEVDGVQIDCRVQFAGPIDVQLSIGRGRMVQVGVTGVIFDGTVSMVIKPMLGEMPVVGGVQLFCLNDPMIRLKFGGILNMFAQLPVLKGLIRKALKRALRQQLVLPNRMYVKIARFAETGKLSLATLRAPPPEGIVRLWVSEVVGLPVAESTVTSMTALNILSAVSSNPSFVIVKVGAMRHRSELVPNADPTSCSTLSDCFDFFVHNVRQHVRIKIHRDTKNHKKGELLAELLPRIDVEMVLKDFSENGGWYDLKAADKPDGAPEQRATVNVRVRLRAKYFQFVHLGRCDDEEGASAPPDRECCVPGPKVQAHCQDARQSCTLGDFEWFVAGAAMLLGSSAASSSSRALLRGPPGRPWLRTDSSAVPIGKQLRLWRAAADSEGLPNLMLAVKFLSGVAKLMQGFPGFTSKDVMHCRFKATIEGNQLRSRSALVDEQSDHGASAGTGETDEDVAAGRFKYVTLSWNSAHYLFAKDPQEANLKLELHPPSGLESNGVIEYQPIPVIRHVEALDRPFRGAITLQQVRSSDGSMPMWCADLTLEIEWQLRTTEVAELTFADASARTDERRQYWV